MPIAHIYILEGRSQEQKADAIAKVTAALCDSLDSPAERVRVLFHEIHADDWGIAGVPASTARR